MDITNSYEEFSIQGVIEESSRELGDANGNNQVGVNDTLSIHSYLAGAVEYSLFDKISADINLDTIVSEVDGTLFDKYAFGNYTMPYTYVTYSLLPDIRKSFPITSITGVTYDYAQMFETGVLAIYSNTPIAANTPITVTYLDTSNKNIQMKQYAGDGYDNLYPATKAEIASYDNSTTHSTATNVQDVVDELFTSVSNGKTSLASAITDKGQSTSPTDSFSTMATKINNIQTFKPEQSKTATQNGVTVYPDSGMALSSVNVAVTEYQGEIVPPPTNVFNDNSWKTIKNTVQAGTASSYWKVGDRKEVILNGTVGDKIFSDTITYCYILGFDHNKDVESNGEHALHIGFGATALTGGAYIAYCDSQCGNSVSTTGYFSMNSSLTNSGGWNGSDGTGCQMKKVICPKFKEALPPDLQTNIRAVTKWQNNGNSTTGQHSDDNEIWLLSEMEIFGSATWSGYTENQLQYDFYKGVTGWSAAPKIKYKDTDTSTDVYWWERSATSSISYSFCIVHSNGNAIEYYAYYSFGFAPCLCL